MQNILGISLGTRLLGMAVLYDGELIDFRVRTFYGKWTDKKRSDLIKVIRKAVVRYGVSAVAIKTPIPALSSEHLDQMLHDIRLLSEQMHIKITVCTIEQLKREYGESVEGNKWELAQAIIRKHPRHEQLAKLLLPEKEHRNAYHVKLFEAIAAAEIEQGTR